MLCLLFLVSRSRPRVTNGCAHPFPKFTSKSRLRESRVQLTKPFPRGEGRAIALLLRFAYLRGACMCEHRWLSLPLSCSNVNAPHRAPVPSSCLNLHIRAGAAQQVWNKVVAWRICRDYQIFITLQIIVHVLLSFIQKIGLTRLSRQIRQTFYAHT